MELRVNPTAPLAEQIRVARERADLTQVELAAVLGVSPRTVQNWERNGDSVPRPKHRRAIANFLRSLDGVVA
jgi:DNA-binding transcriptional regulator YiaG